MARFCRAERQHSCPQFEAKLPRQPATGEAVVDPKLPRRASFDRLVSGGQQCGRNVEAKQLGYLEVMLS
jgi:hypothetical protein